MDKDLFHSKVWHCCLYNLKEAQNPCLLQDNVDTEGVETLGVFLSPDRFRLKMSSSNEAALTESVMRRRLRLRPRHLNRWCQSHRWWCEMETSASPVCAGWTRLPPRASRRTWGPEPLITSCTQRAPKTWTTAPAWCWSLSRLWTCSG